MSMLIQKAPAKINWSLYILGKRDDGYHNILSLMHCLELYDTLIFEPSDTIEIITDMNIPCEENLIYKATIGLKAYAGVKRGAKIILKKEIPIGAGLGGGSSNAVATLIGLNKLWGLNLNTDELKMIGSKLGSDVPFFFHCPIAIVEGKGEILSPLKIDKSYALLLIKPPFSISTAWAYEKIGADSKVNIKLTKIEDKLNNIKQIYSTLNAGNISSLKSLVHNDFEEIVAKRYPELNSLKQRLLDVGAYVASMSGSGSTVFGLFDNIDKATVASKLFSSYWNKVVLTEVK